MQYFMPSHTQHLACGSQFRAPLAAQRAIVVHASAKVRGLPISKAQQAGVRSVTMSHQQRAAKGAAFIIGMCSNAEQAKVQPRASAGKWI